MKNKKDIETRTQDVENEIQYEMPTVSVCRTIAEDLTRESVLKRQPVPTSKTATLQMFAVNENLQRVDANSSIPSTTAM